MKKLTKLLISFCLLLILPFTFIACDGADGDGDGSSSNKPDVSTASAYANWLTDNYDITKSYVACVDNNESDFEIQYEYDASSKVQKYAYYEDGGMIFYYELKKENKNYNIEVYDIESSKYIVETITEDEYYDITFNDIAESIDTSNIIPAGIMRMRIMFGFRHYNGELTANTYLHLFDDAEVEPTSTVSEIEKIYDGKYALKTKAYDSTKLLSESKFTYKDNLIDEIDVVYYDEHDGDFEFEVEYEYKTVNISINKSKFTTYADTSSAENYAKWLDENKDITKSYVAEMSIDAEDEQTKAFVKYQYDDVNKVQKYAVHSGAVDGTMIAYLEVQKQGENFKITGYSMSSKVYIEEIVTPKQLYSLDYEFGEAFFEALREEQEETVPEEGQIAVDLAIQIEMIVGYMTSRQFAADMLPSLFLNFSDFAEDSEVEFTESESSILFNQNGQYELSKNIFNEEVKTGSILLICENDMIVSGMMDLDGGIMNVKYEYDKTVSVSFDKTGYTLYSI